MIALTEKQRTDAIRACEGIEAALGRQQTALGNIIRIFENLAAGRDPKDGLKPVGGGDQKENLDELSSAHCPECGEPELEYGTCKYCGHSVGAPRPLRT